MERAMGIETDQITFGEEAVQLDCLLQRRGIGTQEKAIELNPYFKWVRENSTNLTNEHLASLASNLAPFGFTGRQLFVSVWVSSRRGDTEEGEQVFKEAIEVWKAKKRPATYGVLQSQGYSLTSEDTESNPAEDTLRAQRDLDLAERGITFDKSGKLRFNANVFVGYFQTRVVIVEHGNSYYVYDSAGFFREATYKIVRKLAHIIVHEAKANIWHSVYGDEILEVLSLQVPQFSEMNLRQHVINLINCMIDPLTGETFKHSPEFLTTVQLAYKYDPDARCPTFSRFLSEVMLDDQELIQLVQEILGYLLMYDTRIQKSFFFYGEGANGKSLLAEVIRHLCGKRNVSNTSLRRLEGRFGMQDLPNKTVNISTENEFNGREINTQTFKAIVGGDAVSIERKFKAAYSTKLFVRLVVLMNNLPQTRDLSHGYFRKIQFVPFRRTFLEGEADMTLLDRILLEMPGILNFALDGLRRLASNEYRLTEAKAAAEVLTSYVEEQNPFIDFCRDALSSDNAAVVSRADLQKAFAKWCLANGLNDWVGLQSQRFWALFRGAASRTELKFEEKKVRGIRKVVGIRAMFDVDTGDNTDTMIPFANQQN